jgi:hypothetical protein
VLPGADQELLPAGALLEPDEVLDRAREEDVVPAADVQPGHRDPLIAPGDARRPPAVVVARVLEPVEEVGRVVPRQRRELAERQLGEPVRACGRRVQRRQPSLVARPPRCVEREPRRPAGREGKRKGAAVVRPALVVLRRRHAGADRDEARRPGRRREQLRRARVGEPVHRDPAVGAWEARRPLHGVVAVLRFVNERVPLALRAEAAAAVLDDDDPALSRPPGRMRVAGAGLRRRLVVRLAHEQHGVRVFPGWPVDIGVERHTVPHPAGDVPLDSDLRGTGYTRSSTVVKRAVVSPVFSRSWIASVSSRPSSRKSVS